MSFEEITKELINTFGKKTKQKRLRPLIKQITVNGEVIKYNQETIFYKGNKLDFGLWNHDIKKFISEEITK